MSKCTCTTCADCNGSGNVWWSFSGEYLGNSRCDDLDELETCDECDGTGIVSMCDNCHMQQELEEAEEWEREQSACAVCGA